MPRLSPAHLARALGLLAALSLSAGCPDKDKPAPGAADVGGGGGLDASDPSNGVDAGTPDSGPPPCTYDEDCAADQRCDDEARVCIPAVPCQDTPATCNCASPNDPECVAKFAYCDATVGLGCRCVESDLATGSYTGFCKRRLPACSPCTTDEQCGSDPIWFSTSPFHNEGYCVEYGGTKVCLEKHTASKCGCGDPLQIGAMTYCAPSAGGSCADGTMLCCSGNDECPSESPVCDLDTGRCKGACTYNFDSAETLGCPPGKVCNVDVGLLEETSVFFGAGYCAASCLSDGECRLLEKSGPDFVCKAETGSEARCRPSGCLDDLECADPGQDVPNSAFCERSSGSCICSPGSERCFCRTSTDPVTGIAYDDCKSGYKCDNGTCVKKNCVEMGGAESAGCPWDSYCCGDDRNNNQNFADDPCTDPSTGQVLAAFGECYPAPTPPWCTSGCQADYECRGGAFPTSAIDPNLCADLGNGPICLIACQWRTECPVGHGCVPLEVFCDPTNTASNECGDVARCPQLGVDQDGKPWGKCKCTTPGAVGGECPTVDPRGNGESWTARCNEQKYCQWTRACMPGRNSCLQ